MRFTTTLPDLPTGTIPSQCGERELGGDAVTEMWGVILWKFQHTM